MAVLESLDGSGRTVYCPVGESESKSESKSESESEI